MARCDTGFISSPGALTLVLILCLLFGLEGCQSKPSAVETQAGSTSYQMRGIVVSSDAAKGVVTIDTEAIPGLMGAMTMPYPVKDSHLLDNLSPGDQITAKVVSASGDVWLENIVTVNAGAPAK